MEKNNRPVGRDQHVTGGSGKVEKHGSGLNLGGPQGDNKGRGSSSGGSGRKVATRAGGSSLLIILLVIIFMMFGRGGSSGSSSGGSSSGYTGGATGNYQSQTGSSESSSGGQSGQTGGHSGYYETPSSTTDDTSDTVDTAVASGARERFTKLKGDGTDTATIMVYMCGTDLESRSRMATMDLSEMIGANIDESKVRVLVYTGGCSNWRNNIVSSSTNQIYQVAAGGLRAIQQNLGSSAMTDERNLGAFIKWCAANYPADRYGLICWDHGGGTLSGYGYDEKYPNSGSITADELPKALAEGGCKFDFIGFDACLMATLETAIACEPYADYLIASEETEPGIGWYYTDWLTAWGGNTSMETLDIGKQICDDFVSKCATACRGQQTTLSLIDLAELEHTIPSKLKTFSQSVSSLISGQQYKTVSNARNGSREFGSSASVDMVDLTDLCNKLNTQESAALAKVIQSAVKYNRTGNISSAYGLSIYFPYKKMSNVDKAVNTYAAIGMDADYAKAIRAFAQMEASGQAVSGGYSSPMPSLFDLLGGGSGSSSGSYSTGSSSSSGDLMSELLSSFLGGGYGRIGLTDDNSNFLSNRELADSDVTAFLADNMLDASALRFASDGNGNYVLDMKPENWALVTSVDQNIFYDNGEGYVDLGRDNLFTFDDQGRMVADMDGTWLALNGQPVPYYRETAQYLDNGGWIITGRVPALLNGDRVDLLIVFDNENENGYVAGARAVYGDETDMVAKAITELQDGDSIILLADKYDYQQNYEDSYHFGKPLTVSGDLQVSNVYLPDKTKALVTYRFTDIYNQNYWTPIIGK